MVYCVGPRTGIRVDRCPDLSSVSWLKKNELDKNWKGLDVNYGVTGKLYLFVSSLFFSFGLVRQCMRKCSGCTGCVGLEKKELY